MEKSKALFAESIIFVLCLSIKLVFFFFNWKPKVDVCRMLSFTINKAWLFQWKNQKAIRKPEMTALQTGLGPCNAGAGNRQRSHAAQQPYRYRSASPHYHYRSAPSRPPRWNTSTANLICWSQRRKWSELGKSIELRPISPTQSAIRSAAFALPQVHNAWWGAERIQSKQRRNKKGKKNNEHLKS